MADINQAVYNASLEALVSAGVPEPLADAASRIVASDDETQLGLGRNDADIQVCQSVAQIYTQLTQGDSN